ncbi:MAG: serine hydrolase domain-containing protein [Gemmatimonadota bacterium]
MEEGARTLRGRKAGLPAALLAGVLTAAIVMAVAGGGEPADVRSESPGSVYQPRLGPTALAEIVRPVQQQVEDSAFAGAAIYVGVRDLEAAGAGVGNIGWTRNAAPVDPDSTIYDLASLTKVVATAAAVMLLVDEGRIRLDDPVSHHLPDFSEGPKAKVTFRHLLTHTSGLPAGALLLGDGRAQRIARAATFPIFPPAGAREEYSDVGFVLLWEAAERAAGEPLHDYLERKLYGPLGMTSTGFMPGLDCERCAPTGRLQDQSLYRGRPFDPIAQRLDGVTGNSGLFSTAADLGRFAAMITTGGELDGVRVLSEETVREFAARQPVGRDHGLAWEISCGDPLTPDSLDENPTCEQPRSIGHTGWTGTSLRIDLATGAWVVLLTNRTYEPRGPNRIAEVRREVFARVVEAATTSGVATSVQPPDAY